MMNLGFKAKRDKDAEAKADERLNAKVARNDALFESADFRDFLDDLANRAAYFQSVSGLPDNYRSAALALREIVNGLILNSTRGAGWLRDYAAAKAVKPKQENTDA